MWVKISHFYKNNYFIDIGGEILVKGNKIKSPCVIFYGDDEVKKYEVKLRNLKTGEESSVKTENLVNEIKKIIWKNP